MTECYVEKEGLVEWSDLSKTAANCTWDFKMYQPLFVLWHTHCISADHHEEEEKRSPFWHISSQKHDFLNSNV